MKEVRFSDHARLKMEVLTNHLLAIAPEFVVETVRSPDKLELGQEDKQIAHQT